MVLQTARPVIQERISLIQNIFSTAKSWVHKPEHTIESHLSEIDPLYISVAFEGYSMGMALIDFENDAPLSSWFMFYTKQKIKHGSQLCVGLGWAFDEKNINPSVFFEHFQAQEQVRILDGMGYHSGLFNRRLSIRSQEYPSTIIENKKPFFDQGLGRCLWYLSGGNAEKLIHLLGLFPLHRKKNLERGVGIALIYVGAISKEQVKNIRFLLEEDLSLSVGVALALYGRKKSASLTDEFIQLGAMFFSQLDELLLFVENTEGQNHNTPQGYLNSLTEGINSFLKAS